MSALFGQVQGGSSLSASGSLRSVRLSSGGRRVMMPLPAAAAIVSSLLNNLTRLRIPAGGCAPAV